MEGIVNWIHQYLSLVKVFEHQYVSHVMTSKGKTTLWHHLRLLISQPTRIFKTFISILIFFTEAAK